MPLSKKVHVRRKKKGKKDETTTKTTRKLHWSDRVFRNEDHPSYSLQYYVYAVVFLLLSTVATLQVCKFLSKTRGNGNNKKKRFKL
mmetsp:Transcript_20184/g.30719  ORF Transcript_20184/g.30719 Transcript_20184/m.30719 type:complete len:86 (+) Transcript_20184:62-319(+)